MSITFKNTGTGGGIQVRTGQLGGIFVKTLSSPITPPTSAYVTGGLLLYLDAGNTSSYNGSGTTWYDLSGNSRNATLINTPTYDSSTNGGLFSFNDAQFEHATIPDIGDQNVFTVEAWCRVHKSLTGKVTSVVTNQYNLQSGANAKLNFSIGTNRAAGSYNMSFGFFDGNWRNVSGSASSLDVWYHLVGTYDGSSLKFYVNNALDSQIGYVGTPRSGGEIRIARRWDAENNLASNFFDGDISIVRVYNRALNTTEISQNYNADKQRYINVVTGGIVLNLDAASYNGSGNWLDTSGNSNNASSVQSPTYFTASNGYFDLNGGSITATGQVDSFSIADNSTLDTMTSMSIEMWLNTDTIQGVGSANMLFSKRGATTNGYVGFLSTTGYTFRIGTASPTQLTWSTTPTTGSWQQLVITVGSGGSKIYRNGVEVQSTPTYTGSFSNINTDAALLIGDVNPNASGLYGYDGKVSAFRIYNRILSASEVQQNFYAIRDRYGI